MYLAKRINNYHYKFDNKKLKKQVKYLGATIDYEHSYQAEVKNLLTKMAQSIKCFTKTENAYQKATSCYDYNIQPYYWAPLINIPGTLPENSRRWFQ